MEAETPPQPVIPAATLILFRSRDGQPPELLMVERSGGMTFAAGAMVFPGGRVDPDDRALAARFPAIDPDDAAARIAAIRETIEESGLGIGLSPVPDALVLAELRAALASGATPFSALIDAHDLSLDLDLLTPFARWWPNHREFRVFDTRFYVAAADGAPEPMVDDTENVHALWTSASDVLVAADAGKARIIFPTKCNLQRLATFGSHADAVADTIAHPVEIVSPWIEDRDGAPHLCIPDNIGYPITGHLLATAERA